MSFAEDTYDICVAEDLDDIIEFTDWVHRLTTTGYTVLGLDVESTGLDPWADDFKVTLVQVSDGYDTWVIPTHVTGAVTALRGALEHPRVKVATHSQYDAVALLTIGVALGPKVIDTYVLSKLLNPGNSVPHGLKPLTREWLKAEQLEEADAARFALFKSLAPKELQRAPRRIETWGWGNVDPLSDAVLLYAGLDALAVRQLAPVLTKALKAARVPLRLIEQELWLATVASSMRMRGMRVDVQRVEDLLREHNEHMSIAKAEITRLTGLAPLSPKRVEWLQERGVTFDPERVTPKGRPQLDKDSLPDLIERYKDNPGVYPVLFACHTLSERKNLVGNLEGFLKHCDAEGYVHPEIQTLRARTGRMSITNPALQTLKKSDTTLRGCFLAEPGMSLISADFSQIEIRVAAALSGDAALTAPILEGRDTHDDTAQRLFGEDFTPEHRQIAKTVNFGSLYGGGAGTLSKQSGIALEEARAVVTKWKATYKQVARMSHMLSGMNVIVNPCGRRIPTDPDRPYSNLNYMIQSTARDLFVVAVERIVKELGVTSLWLFVHDEVILQVPEDQAERVAAQVQQIMHTTFYGIPIDAEAEIMGDRWGKK